jgi:4-oxalocrotonate tautomerase
MPLIQVTMVAGRTPEQKHALIHGLSEAAAAALDTPIDRVRVAIYEVSADEWGIGGRSYAEARATTAQPQVQSVADRTEDA